MQQLDHELMNKNLYITQFDTDIAWFSIFKGNFSRNPNISANISTPFSTSIDEAEKYGHKITQLALEKGALMSSLNYKKTSYPIIGHVIFTVKFISKPKVNFMGQISREKLLQILRLNSHKYDVTSYIPNWMSASTLNEIRYIFHPSSYSKLNLIHIKLIKTTSIDEHIAFCLFNALAVNQDMMMTLKHIQLIKELLSNGNGKSFKSNPYYDKYLKYKTIYLSNKNKINN